LIWIKRAGDAICVDLPRSDSRHERVPIMVSAMCGRIELDDVCRVNLVDAIEEQELNPGCPPRKHAEVHTVREDGSAKREAPP
jgi:hypothetical protein